LTPCFQKAAAKRPGEISGTNHQNKQQTPCGIWESRRVFSSYFGAAKNVLPTVPLCGMKESFLYRRFGAGAYAVLQALAVSIPVFIAAG